MRSYILKCPLKAEALWKTDSTKKHRISPGLMIAPMRIYSTWALQILHPPTNPAPSDPPPAVCTGRRRPEISPFAAPANPCASAAVSTNAASGRGDQKTHAATGLRGYGHAVPWLR